MSTNYEKPTFIPTRPKGHPNELEPPGSVVKLVSEHEEIIISDGNHYSSSVGHSYTIQEMISAIYLANGNMTEVGRILRLSRPRVVEMVAKYPELEDAVYHAKERELDLAEVKLRAHIHDFNNFQALKFFLERIGKNRGYGSRKENVNVSLDLSRLTDDQLQELAQGKRTLEEILADS